MLSNVINDYGTLIRCYLCAKVQAAVPHLKQICELRAFIKVDQEYRVRSFTWLTDKRLTASFGTISRQPPKHLECSSPH